MAIEQGNQLIPPSLPDSYAGVNGFFNIHLDRLYCAASHLVERLGEIEGQEDDPALNDAIAETIHATEAQLALVEKLYDVAQRKYSFEHCGVMIQFLNEYFTAIQKEVKHTPLRILLFTAYLVYVRSVERASLHLLLLSANQIGSKQIDGLLKSCSDCLANDHPLLSILNT